MPRARRETDIAWRCADAFDAEVRAQGRRYHAEGRVALGRSGAPVEAGVRGSQARQYHTTLSAPDGRVLRLSCTCASANELEPCKHMWAVLLAADQFEAGPSLEGSGLVDVIVTNGRDEELYPAPKQGARALALRDPNQLDGDLTLEERGSLRRPKGTSTWQSKLKQLDEARSAVRDRAPMAMPLEYLFQVRGAMPGVVLLWPMRRMVRADGTPGALRDMGSADLSAEPLTREDHEIVERLGYHAHDDGVADSSENAKLAPVLPRIARAGQLRRALPGTKSESVPLTWAGDDPFRLVLALNEEAEGGVGVEWLLRRGEEQWALRDCLAVVGAVALFQEHALLLDEAPPHALWTLFNEGDLRAPAPEVDAFITMLTRTPLVPPLELAPELGWSEARVTPVPLVRFGAPDRDDDQRALPVDLWFTYEDREVAYADERAGLAAPSQKRMLLRDGGAERAAWERLLQLGVLPRGSESHGVLAPRLLPSIAPELLAAGWRVEARGRRLRRARSLAMKVSSGIDWFDLSVEAAFEGSSLAITGLLSALRRGERFVALDDGTLGMLPEQWIERYAPLVSAGEAEGDSLRFRKCQVSILDALLSLAPEVDVDAKFAQLRHELHSFERLAPEEPPTCFVGELRPYQKEGLAWLRFLERVGFGGCLADDMGLGKTVQVLALLAGRPAGVGPWLVVAPKSLVANWKDEAERFTPSLRILDYTGPSRRHAAFEDHDLVLTTYGTLRRDIEQLREQTFDYAILDEAQAIKNPKANISKAARLLTANNRLALTGTPIENGIADLASIFDFLNPGMIDGVDSLRALSSAQVPDDLDLLRRALKPFLLRRTKEAVLPELPEKTEQTLRCRLEGRQRKLYDQLLSHYRASLETRIAKSGLASSKIHVLEALLRLRQAACHAGLLEESLRSAPSAKLEVLVDSLLEVTAGGHKALVFSQFTSFLDIVRARLKHAGIPISYLDGQTSARKRVAAVHRFQNDPDCLAFLISLKAGGTGLNLTAADYVFLLDPWWNPAVETQAIDRTHRIGQTRPVFAYRLIAEDTIEEKVLALQQSKRRLADGLLSADETLLRGLTAEDLAALLE